TNRSRLELILEPEKLDRLTLLQGDIGDLDALDRAIGEQGVTHVVHLAALLIPQVRESPPFGALVNVVGTANVFEAARRRGVRGVSYASSAAVYGQHDGSGVEDARSPGTLYGVFKLANEGTARVFSEEHGL